MDKEIIVKRLAHIKQLFKIGIRQSNQHESISVFSILAFHDSIEMFLNLLSENKGINSGKFGFMDYWEKIPELTLKESMRKLNQRRVNIKHKGLLPAKSEIELSRVNAIEFFEQNTKEQFDIEFADISLIELINYETVKSELQKSQDYLNENNNQESIKFAAIAFDNLLTEYEESKTSWNHTPFFFGKRMSFNYSHHLGFANSKIPRELRKIKEFADDFSNSIQGLQNAMKIISLGIDYKEYIKFNVLTPEVIKTGTNENYIPPLREEIKLTTENCQYCIDFVVNSSLKLQEFDFELDSLEVVQRIR